MCSRQRAALVVFCVSFAFIFGCKPEEEQSATSERSSTPVPAASQVDVAVGDRSALDQLIASQKGKVVLVDFWATWCGPCVQQFPHTVALSGANPEHLAVISVSMDEPEDLESVRAFLKKQDATFPNLVSKYGVGQEGFDAFGIEDGAIPHYAIYDRQGKLRHQVKDNGEVDALVEALLTEH